MSRVNSRINNVLAKQAKHHNNVAKSRNKRRVAPSGKRARGGQQNEKLPFAPPEDWHEPTRNGGDYRIVVQPPGEGHRHVVTPQEVRERLNELPAHFLRDLEVVQFSRMTAKKKSFPCYGMQWGNALYLYPLEDSLIEYFYHPPHPSLVSETRMYGARWERQEPGPWMLIWSDEACKDFYLNNILIHELGHLVDDRNSSYADRERYAEWFAIHYGYRPSRKRAKTGPWAKKKQIRRRHHAV